MTNNQLAENSVIQLLNSVKLARDNAERADNRVDHSFYYALTIALEELQERRKAAMDSEPNCKERKLFCSTDTARMRKVISASAGAEATPLYRHAQQPAPVVPDDVLDALQKVARIRLDLNDFDGDRRGIADCLCEAEEALIEVVNRRAAMLHLGNSPAQSDCCPAQNVVAPAQNGDTPAQSQGWIQVSEQMPPSRHEVLVGRWWGEKPRWCCKWATYIPGHPDAQSSGWLIPGASWTPTHWTPTHWMQLPAGPQEVKGE